MKKLLLTLALLGAMSISAIAQDAPSLTAKYVGGKMTLKWILPEEGVNPDFWTIVWRAIPDQGVWKPIGGVVTPITEFVDNSPLEEGARYAYYITYNGVESNWVYFMWVGEVLQPAGRAQGGADRRRR